MKFHQNLMKHINFINEFSMSIILLKISNFSNEIKQKSNKQNYWFWKNNEIKTFSKIFLSPKFEIHIIFRYSIFINSILEKIINQKLLKKIVRNNLDVWCWSILYKYSSYFVFVPVSVSLALRLRQRNVRPSLALV